MNAARRSANLELPVVAKPDGVHSDQPASGVVDCSGCGACCQHMGFPSYVMETEDQPAETHWLTMPADVKAELLCFMDSYVHPVDGNLDGVCCWYDVGRQRCKHHQHRPNVCRDFQVGSWDCLAWRDVYAD